MAKATTPPAYDGLLEQLSKLPGVGKRSAERIAFFLLKQPEPRTLALAEAIRRFATDLTVCSVTGMVSESDPSPIARDPDRDHSTIMVVEQPADVISMEQVGGYRGSYHVLMGRLSPLDAVGPGDLNMASLLDRVRQGTIREVILALNSTLESDGTALHLQRELESLNVKVTRLARGVPLGQHLQGVSKAALSEAIANRG